MNYKDNPYEYICDWAESIFKHTGKRVFKYMSLMPVSLIIPDILYKGRQIRSNIHVLLLAPSGTAKTSLGTILSNFSLNPIPFENITTAKISQNLMRRQDSYVTLISTDISKIVRDLELVKLLEQVLGEERRVMRDNMQSSFNFTIQSTAYLSGVPSDLLGVLTSGLLFRTSPIILFHTEDEHSDIGKHITEGIGQEAKNDGKEGIIKDFYNSLAYRQSADNPDRIEGYIYSEEIKNKIFQKWNEMTHDIVKKYQVVEWIRELYSCYRYMNAYSFMNITSREVKKIDGKNMLVITNEDLKLALNLMEEDIDTKVHLLKCKAIANKIRNMKELQEVMESKKASDRDKQIIKNLVKS